MKKILYLSYDGMTDPLGQSQVINYLIGLSQKGFQFDILSFEKPAKYDALGGEIKAILDANKIGWYPQVFHQQIPVLSKVMDRKKLFKTATGLHKQKQYDIIHCRSYISAETGQKLKKATGVKFLFDMRGFWADEKKDGNSWDTSKFFWKKVYDHYKKKEKEFVQQSDHIISLTRAGKMEIESWAAYTNVPISVIPCCTNADFFTLTSSAKKKSAREALNIPADSFVVSYLGSLGTWYLLDEMIEYFKLLLQQNSNSFFLIITNSKPEEIIPAFLRQAIEDDKYIVISVPFSKVPSLMFASDVSINFTKPAYSKLASSPVKVGEILTMGIPIIANDVGDTGVFIKNNNVGIMLRDITEASFKQSISEISTLNELDAKEIRNVALKEYSLDSGIESYSKVYSEMVS